MEIFERIRRRSDELHQILVEFFPWTMPILDLTAAPRKTLQVFLLSMAKIDFLKSGIFDLCESDNPYAAKVLYRSLVEHHAQRENGKAPSRHRDCLIHTSRRCLISKSRS